MRADRQPKPNQCKGIAMTSQNLVSLTLTDTQLSIIDQSLTELETQLVDLIAMNTAQRRSLSLSRMGDKSETFCRTRASGSQACC
jgi:hypothetical protein